MGAYQPLIPGREANGSLQVQSQPDLHNKFQNNQGYTQTFLQNKTNHTMEFNYKLVRAQFSSCIIFREYLLLKIELPQVLEVRKHTQVGKYQLGLPQPLSERKSKQTAVKSRREECRWQIWARKCVKIYHQTLSDQKRVHQLRINTQVKVLNLRPVSEPNSGVTLLFSKAVV